MEITIKINDKAARAIAGIAHNAGTAEMYVNTLSRLFDAVLYNQDDLGMDDTEAITTLQALGLLRSDIEDIAGSWLRQFPFEPAITEKVDFGPVDLTDAAEKLRAFMYVAYNKAVSLLKLVNDITDNMQHADRDAAEIDKIREVAELATKAAKITKQAIDREDTRAADDQEGADK